MNEYVNIYCLEPANLVQDMAKDSRDWLRKMFQIMPCLPDNVIAVVPPRRDDESEEAWLARCVMIRNIGTTEPKEKAK